LTRLAAVIALPIRTRSLLLRRFVPEDAQRMFELNAEPSTGRWLPSHMYASRQQAEAALRHLIGAYAAPGDPRHGPFVLGIEHLGSGALVGHVGFSPLVDEVEVSYAVAESARRHGLGTEALDAACEWAGRSFDLPGIVAVTAGEIVASRRTLERAGFVHILDDAMRFQGEQQTVSRYRRRFGGTLQGASITAYEPTDAKDIVPMWRESFEHGMRFTDPNSLQSLHDFLLREVVPANTLHVARRHSGIVGFMASTPQSVTQLFVRVECIGQGIGTQLLELAKHHSDGRLWLYAFARNTHACRFYERHGFLEVERESENMYKMEAIRYEWVGQVVRGVREE
jgi:RimJ/RimL family protein N-acetyltransferase